MMARKSASWERARMLLFDWGACADEGYSNMIFKLLQTVSTEFITFGV